MCTYWVYIHNSSTLKNALSYSSETFNCAVSLCLYTEYSEDSCTLTQRHLSLKFLYHSFIVVSHKWTKYSTTWNEEVVIPSPVSFIVVSHKRTQTQLHSHKRRKYSTWKWLLRSEAGLLSVHMQLQLPSSYIHLSYVHLRIMDLLRMDPCISLCDMSEGTHVCALAAQFSF